jgi:hypothetical protein
MSATMLVNSKAEYAAILAGITNQTAVANIRLKEAVVVKYYKDAFGIDFISSEMKLKKILQL